MINKILKSCFICILLFVPTLFAQAGQKEITQSLTASLITDQTGMNHFDLAGDVNTLTPLLGTLTEQDEVNLSGNIILELNLVMGDEPSELVVSGIRFTGGSIQQTSMNFQYSIATGTVAFSADPMGTKLQSNDMAEFTPVDNREFIANSVHLVQEQGMAIIQVPEKPSVEQKLAEHQVRSTFNPEIASMQQPMGIVDISKIYTEQQITTYQVDVQLPLAGQALLFEKVGLPTNVTYLGGKLVASGTFQLIPEPASLALLMSFLGGTLILRCRPKPS